MNWFMVLARGKVHVEVMPEAWHLDGAGLAEFVRRLPKVLEKMLGANTPKPRTVFTDRGTGMYTGAGMICRKFEQALKEEGFRTYWGRDASKQSPDMGDVLLHETAVAWFRKLMRKETPEVAPWEETQEQWTRRARKVVRLMNQKYDVLGLCRDFPRRLEDVLERKGDRLAT